MSVRNEPGASASAALELTAQIIFPPDISSQERYVRWWLPAGGWSV